MSGKANSYQTGQFISIGMPQASPSWAGLDKIATCSSHIAIFSVVINVCHFHLKITDIN